MPSKRPPAITVSGGVAAGARAHQVAAGIQAHRQAGRLEFGAQPLARLLEQRREGASRPGHVRQGHARQGFDARPEALGVQGRKCRGHGNVLKREKGG